MTRKRLKMISMGTRLEKALVLMLCCPTLAV